MRRKAEPIDRHPLSPSRRGSKGGPRELSITTLFRASQMDEAQVDAGIELTLDICRRHDIEPSFYYPSTRFDFPRCFQVATIVCHSNCRRDKTDLALPEWVYERVEGAGIRLVS